VTLIRPALCFVDADWDFFAKPFQLGDVWVLWGRKLAEFIAGPGPLSKEEVVQIGNRLASALPLS